MTLDALRFNHLAPLGFKGLNEHNLSPFHAAVVQIIMAHLTI